MHRRIYDILFILISKSERYHNNAAYGSRLIAKGVSAARSPTGHGVHNTCRLTVERRIYGFNNTDIAQIAVGHDRESHRNAAFDAILTRKGWIDEIILDVSLQSLYSAGKARCHITGRQAVHNREHIRGRIHGNRGIERIA